MLVIAEMDKLGILRPTLYAPLHVIKKKMAKTPLTKKRFVMRGRVQPDRKYANQTGESR